MVNKVEIDKLPLDIKPEVLDTRESERIRIDRKRALIEGASVLYMVVSARPDARFATEYDHDLFEKGIEVSAGGLLIDQGATKERLGRAAGFKPETFLEKQIYPDGATAVCPTNAGWQRGAVIFADGQPVMLENDRGNLQGRFDVIGCANGVWRVATAEFQDGQIVQGDTADLIVGFTMPLVVRDGEVVDLSQIIGDPRFIADYRNVLDFGPQAGLPAEFFELIRDFLPTMGVSGRRLIGDRVIVVNPKDVDLERAQRLDLIIQEHDLGRWMRMDFGKRPRLVVQGLPLNRIPVVGIGFNGKGQLLEVAVDGRQKESAGVTLTQLGNLMKSEGAVYGGVGSAGGDVAVVAKNNGKPEVLNSPSNKDHQTRLVPGVLVVY